MDQEKNKENEKSTFRLESLVLEGYVMFFQSCYWLANCIVYELDSMVQKDYNFCMFLLEAEAPKSSQQKKEQFEADTKNIRAMTLRYEPPKQQNMFSFLYSCLDVLFTGLSDTMFCMFIYKFSWH